MEKTVAIELRGITKTFGDCLLSSSFLSSSGLCFSIFIALDSLSILAVVSTRLGVGIVDAFLTVNVSFDWSPFATASTELICFAFGLLRLVL